ILNNHGTVLRPLFDTVVVYAACGKRSPDPLQIVVGHWDSSSTFGASYCRSQPHARHRNDLRNFLRPTSSRQKAPRDGGASLLRVSHGVSACRSFALEPEPLQVLLECL